MKLKVGKQPNVYQSEKNDWVVTLDANSALRSARLWIQVM